LRYPPDIYARYGGDREIARDRTGVTAITFGFSTQCYQSVIETTRRHALTADPEMNRREREEIERKLAQARRQALEPTDPQTLERLAQQIEELEYQLLASRLAA
jgi:hypothetical protein